MNEALDLLIEEMNAAGDSLSLAMYEYASSDGKEGMADFAAAGEKKWSDLIEYGIRQGEFLPVNVPEITALLMYAYQGVRMWSRIVAIEPATNKAIIDNIRRQLLKES